MATTKRSTPARRPAPVPREATPVLVSHHMTAHPHTIGQEQPMQLAHDLMRKYRVRHLPVLHSGRVVGIVSDRDLGLLQALPDVDPEQTSVEEAMSTDVYLVAPDASLADTVDVMAERRLGSAVVVENGHVCGVFTTTDALRALSHALRAIF